MRDSLLFLRRAMAAIAFTGSMIAILSYCSNKDSAQADKPIATVMAKENPKAPSMAHARTAGSTTKGSAYSLNSASPKIIAE